MTAADPSLAAAGTDPAAGGEDRILTIPNVISPNGDEQNDYFVIDNIEFWSNELTIYGRWGNKVYQAKNYVNQWKADGLPEGTYYYVLTLNDGKEHAGHITVLR